jgi:hypothetical protein
MNGQDIIRIVTEQGYLTDFDLQRLASTSRGVSALVLGELQGRQKARLEYGLEQAKLHEDYRPKFVYRQLMEYIPLVNIICPYFGITVHQLAAEYTNAIAQGHSAALSYHGGRGKQNRLSDLEAGGFTLTSRSLVLDRFLRLPGCGAKSMTLMPWSGLSGPDNYITCLGLTDGLLTSWKGCAVLDIASGGSPFYAEAAVCYGINVIPVDLHADNYPPIEICAVYAKNMLFAEILRLNDLEIACGMAPVPSEIFDRLIKNLPAIISYYRRHSVSRGSVFKLEFCADHFHVCITSWMFSYFKDPADRVSALVELIRVTKVGGQMRVCTGRQGDMDLASERITNEIRSKANAIASQEYGKTIELAESSERVLVYKVVRQQQCNLM